MPTSPDQEGVSLAMNAPRIVSTQQWEAAREQLLVKEKALTRARDAMAAEQKSQRSTSRARRRAASHCRPPATRRRRCSARTVSAPSVRTADRARSIAGMSHCRTGPLCVRRRGRQA